MSWYLYFQSQVLYDTSMSQNVISFDKCTLEQSTFATVHNLFIDPETVKGTTDSNNLFSFTLLMYLSTFILRLAMFDCPPLGSYELSITTQKV
jgi:hypothetical protein